MAKTDKLVQINYLLDGLRKVLLNSDTWQGQWRRGVNRRELPRDNAPHCSLNEGMTLTVEVNGGAIDTLETMHGVEVLEHDE